MIWVVDGGAVAVVVSAPAGTEPSSHMSVITALTEPPLTRTCRAGDASAPLMASTSRATRPRAGTTVAPVGEATRPRRPRTSRSTVTSLAPGLVSTRRSWRPASPPPASSQRSEEGSAHETVASPRISSRSTDHSWPAASPGAMRPLARMSVETPGCASRVVTTPRASTGGASSSPDCRVRRPVRGSATAPRASSGAVATPMRASTSMSSTESMPLRLRAGAGRRGRRDRRQGRRDGGGAVGRRGRRLRREGCPCHQTHAREGDEGEPSGSDPARGVHRRLLEARLPTGIDRNATTAMPRPWRSRHHGCSVGTSTLTVCVPAGTA